MVVRVQSVALSLSLPPTRTVIFFFFFYNSSSHLLFCPVSDYSSLQLFLSCGQKVTIYSKPVGYSDKGPPVSGLPVSIDFIVNSWTNDLKEDFFEAQV